MGEMTYPTLVEAKHSPGQQQKNCRSGSREAAVPPRPQELYNFWFGFILIYLGFKLSKAIPVVYDLAL